MSRVLQISFPITLLSVVALALPAFASQNLTPAEICVKEAVIRPSHSAGTFSAKELLEAAMHLKTTRNPRLMSPEVLEKLRSIAGVKTNEELLNSDRLDRIIARARDVMGEDKFEKTVGSHILGAKTALDHGSTKTGHPHNDDAHDFLRGYGWKLLPDSDPTFQDPTYLADFVKQSNYDGENVSKLKSDELPMNEFRRAWNKIAPRDVELPKIFALSGTDANNLLYEIADKVVARKNNEPVNHGHAEILTFDGVYGGGEGRMGDVGHYNPNMKKRNLRITSPTTTVWDPKDPAEIARVEKLETQALTEIRERVRTGNRPIGGLLLEPIQGSKGVLFYRKEFLLKLRKLCDELQIPIFADEVLTGGGRTGRFFAYQHYDGFVPDYVTFGKGLMVAGIARVNRDYSPATRYFPRLEIGRVTTLQHQNVPLLKSARVMNRIYEGGLMKNAEETGKYFVERMIKREIRELEQRLKIYENLRAKAIREGRSTQAYDRDMPAIRKSIEELKSNPEFRAKVARGMGMLIFVARAPMNLNETAISTGGSRLLPYLTLTPKQIDEILNEDQTVPVETGDASP